MVSFAEKVGKLFFPDNPHKEIFDRIPDLHQRAMVWLRSQQDLSPLEKSVPGMGSILGKNVLSERHFPDTVFFVGLEVVKPSVFIPDIPQIYLTKEFDSQVQIWHLYSRGGICTEDNGRLSYFRTPGLLKQQVMQVEKIIFSIIPTIVG
jgi:hypothetical protein